jgi:hypothetical protein
MSMRKMSSAKNAITPAMTTAYRPASHGDRVPARCRSALRQSAAPGVQLLTVCCHGPCIAVASRCSIEQVVLDDQHGAVRSGIRFLVRTRIDNSLLIPMRRVDERWHVLLNQNFI